MRNIEQCKRCKKYYNVMSTKSQILLVLALLIFQQESSGFSIGKIKPVGRTIAQSSSSTSPLLSPLTSRRPRLNFQLNANDRARFTEILTTGRDERPRWLPDWIPTWMCNMKASTQLVILLLVYALHITVLCQHSIPFPIQLIPNDRGHFQDIGLDSLMGMVSLSLYQYFRHLKRREVTNKETIDLESNGDDKDYSEKDDIMPSLLSAPSRNESPWKNVSKNKFSQLTSFLAFCLLVRAYFWTGRFSIWWEDTFYYLANFFPMTVAMHRSLCVLFGHLSWIGIGYIILRLVPRPQNLFQSQWYTQKFKNTQWLWWTMGGYFVSSWFFNIADFINQWLLPLPILEQAQESVVSQLINPEFNDWLASAVGYIAPCITAPWWEEVLYRGFLLPAFTLNMSWKWSVFWNGIIFSIHHMSPTACIPLAVLGWTWSVLYSKSGNLLTTILVHAMWNSRIFLGSWFGL